MEERERCDESALKMQCWDARGSREEDEHIQKDKRHGSSGLPFSPSPPPFPFRGSWLLKPLNASRGTASPTDSQNYFPFFLDELLLPTT